MSTTKPRVCTLDLGPTPAEEDCAQVGTPDYKEKAKAECARFIKLLRVKFGPEPEGARLRTKGFAHDFGVYHEVVVDFVEGTPAEAYAWNIEANLPGTWGQG